VRTGRRQASDPLDAAAIAAALEGRRIGRELRVFDEVGSTMDTASAHAESGAPDGLVVLAEHQTRGRGRLGRTWSSPPGAGLAISFLFRPSAADAAYAWRIPMAVALGAAEALDSFLAGVGPGLSAPTVSLKWPNDLLLQGEKLGGLLAEASWIGMPESTSAVGGSAPIGAGADAEGARPVDGAAGRLVVGLGLNVHPAPGHFPAGATDLATQAARLGLPSPRRTKLAVDVLTAIDVSCGRVSKGWDPLPEWSARLDTLGKRVVAHPPPRGAPGISGAGVRTGSSTRTSGVLAAVPGRGDATAIEGTAVGVTADGSLRIAEDDGTVHELRAGDVTLAPVESA